MCRPVLHGPRYRARLCRVAEMQQAECIWWCFWRSKHIQALSRPHQISSFQFALCRRAFPDDWLLAWSEVKMSSHNHSMPFKPFDACILLESALCRAFQLANNRHFMIVSLSIFACQVMNPSEADFVVGGIRVNTFSTTTWNMLRLWQCKGCKDQGGMRWQASWMLQNSEPETFAAECACKRDKQATIQVLPKACTSLSILKQERSECSVDPCCDWCHSLPAFLVHPSEIWVFRQQITTPAAHHCKSMVAPSQLEHGQDSSCPPRLYLIHGHIGLESMMCKVLSRQRVFMKQLLGYRVTLRSSPGQDDQNLNLVNSCVGPAETALVSSTCTVTGRSFQQVTWWPMKHRCIEFCLIYCISRNTTDFADCHQFHTIWNWNSMTWRTSEV